jgi:hypothetical protein
MLWQKEIDLLTGRAQLVIYREKTGATTPQLRNQFTLQDLKNKKDL